MDRAARRRSAVCSAALRPARTLARDAAIEARAAIGRFFANSNPTEESDVMAKGQQRSNRETKKPKKDKAKVIAAAPTRKEAGWQPDFGPAKKK
ncbi:hypothetical protein GWG65_15330 [Bradyrhizobium sp. CSA207]|uniref:hypothetical protein n=1 Tax=Bradyrhizobium sp. CSA207 TaxID=2698826 RepID=UPI0023AEFC7F|nr:hypothetical protein [Bradyrhizobium sp. CSA207]MDE5442796.1 hypothetical protein [Bradyrhizobium sp. CSA207]